MSGSEIEQPGWAARIWAFVLSLFFPGLGHVYARRWRAAMAFFLAYLAIFAVCLLILLAPGFIPAAHVTAATFKTLFFAMLLAIFLMWGFRIYAAINAARQMRFKNQRPKLPWFKSTWCAAVVYLVLQPALQQGLDALKPHKWQSYFIPSESNVPSLLIGDFLYAAPAVNIQRGDMVAFHPPGEPGQIFIKRIIGLPGDTVYLRAGQLYINNTRALRQDAGSYSTMAYGAAVQARAFNETLPGGKIHAIIKLNDGPEPVEGLDANNTLLYTVPAGAFFVLGDNRDDSEDSRFLDGPVGYVPVRNVIGIAKIILLSVDQKYPAYEFWRWPSELRWNRLFMPVS